MNSGLRSLDYWDSKSRVWYDTERKKEAVAMHCYEFKRKDTKGG